MGKHSWNVAERSPIGLKDAVLANQRAIAELDASFFRVRFDHLTPVEKRYMRAMAELGPGPHRSGDVAELLGRKVTSVAPMRSALISSRKPSATARRSLREGAAQPIGEPQ